MRSWHFGWWRYGPSKAPLLELRSDGATETTALELPVPIPRTVRIAKHFTIFSVATIFCLVASPALPLIRGASLRSSIFNLTGRLAPRYSRYSHLVQAPCESCGISRFFSEAAIFGLAVSLVAPVAAADASCLAWISHLAGRQAPRLPSSADRHQAPCKSRGISRLCRRRRFFSAATIFGLSRRSSPLSPPLMRVASLGFQI